MSVTDPNQGSAPAITRWEIDPQASRVEFTSRMRLMFVANVKVVGRFSEVKGTLMLDERDPGRSQLNVTIGAASLDTKMAARDKHLRTADFFEVEHYPTITFTAQRIETIDQATDHYKVTGSLTIRDVTRDVTLDVHRVSTRPASDHKMVFNLTTTLDRRDFKITWNGPVQKIADEVTLDLTIQFVPASA